MENIKIIAETGAAHRRSYARCIALIDAARKAGADAVKFSAFRPGEMTLNRNEPPFVINEGVWAGRSLYDLYEEIAIPYNWLPDLRRAAMAAGLEFILSIYHPDTIPILKDIGVRTVKIASFELGFTELLEGLAGDTYVKKIILSTGGAAEDEIKTALGILENKDLTLLYCVSQYPAQAKDMNLRTISDMIKFGFPVGLSNHSLSFEVPVVAAAIGAGVIENHIKLDDDNLDAAFAMFPDRFKIMVDLVRRAETILGEINYNQPKSFHRKEIDGRMLRVVW